MSRPLRTSPGLFATVLGAALALTAASCGDSSGDDATGGAGGTGGASGSGGTGASGTLSNLLTRCNGLCDDAASARCGNDTSGCHTGCSNDLDRFSHCPDQYDAVLDCGEALANVCDLYDASADACSSELGDFVHCVSEYCTANPNDTICLKK